MDRHVLRGGVRGDIGDAVGTALGGDVVTGIDGGVTSEVREVSVAVSQWVEQVGRFLGVVQAALEQSRPREDASAEVAAVVGELPALIRQCRAQVPTPEMIRTWVQTLSEARQAGRPAPPPPVAGGRLSA